MPEILAYVSRAEEDPALDRRVRFETRPGALAGLRAYRVHNAAEGGPPRLACAVADVRYLIDNGLLACAGRTSRSPRPARRSWGSCSSAALVVRGQGAGEPRATGGAG